MPSASAAYQWFEPLFASVRSVKLAERFLEIRAKN
jgi:hypothetical protein